MLKEEIIEGNTAIAIFDGWVTDKNIKDNPYWHPERNMTMYTYPDSFQYHSSWGWLMPVIEKISDHHWPEYYGTAGKQEDDGDFEDCVYPRTFGKRDEEGLYMVRLNASPVFSANTLIEAAWMAVIDFIKGYNTKTP